VAGQSAPVARGWRRRVAKPVADAGEAGGLRDFADRLASSLEHVRQQRRRADWWRSQELENQIGTALVRVNRDEHLAAAPEEASGNSGENRVLHAPPDLSVSSVRSSAVDPVPIRARLPQWTTDVAVAQAEQSIRADRRAYERIPVHRFRGLRAARILNGPNVSLIDLSVGGTLFETDVALKPNAEVTLELVGDRTSLTVPMCILRCQVAALDGRARYRGASAFLKPPPLADLVYANGTGRGEAVVPLPVDRAVRMFLEPVVQRADGRELSSNAWLPGLLQSLRRVIARNDDDEGIKSACRLLASLVLALERSAGAAEAVTLIETHLERTLPGASVTSVGNPEASPDTRLEIIHFTIPGECADRVLRVQIPRDFALQDWQFRLVKAATWLIALVDPRRQAPAIA
jgi:hypothetical protein